MKFKKKFLIFLLSGFFLFSAKQIWAQEWNNMRINIPTPRSAISNLGDLVSAGVTTVIVIAGLLTFLYLVWGGIEWLTSGGDKDKYEAARNRITAALIGLAIISASWAIMQLISHFFGISVTTLNIPSAVKGGGTTPQRTLEMECISAGHRWISGACQ